MTNFEKIKNMSKEELARFLCALETGNGKELANVFTPIRYYCYNSHKCLECLKCWKENLDREAEGDK